MITELKDKCMKCDELIDFDSVDWGIGHFQNMKTKTVFCKNGHQNNYSTNVKNRTTKLLKAILTGKIK